LGFGCAHQYDSNRLVVTAMSTVAVSVMNLVRGRIRVRDRARARVRARASARGGVLG
jgi:hypothetical protein